MEDERIGNSKARLGFVLLTRRASVKSRKEFRIIACLKTDPPLSSRFHLLSRGGVPIYALNYYIFNINL